MQCKRLPSEQTGDVVRGYLRSVERTIREGDVAKREVLDGGVKRLVFHWSVAQQGGGPSSLRQWCTCTPMAG